MNRGKINIYKTDEQACSCSQALHQSVLLKEVLEYFNPQPNENFVDATVGAGGHALAILESIKPNGKLLGIDQNKKAIERLNYKFQNLNLRPRLVLVNDNFVNLSAIVEKQKFGPINGIIADLGLSTDLLEKSGRGFSFQKDEFLNMRFGENGITAYEIINQSSFKELSDLLKDYSEERFSGLIALNIVKNRRQAKIRTSKELVDIIDKSVGKRVPARFKIKIFARIFQAIRIVVNNEIQNLEKFLTQSVDLLTEGGRIGVISFHSIEDRIVKNFFRDKNKIGTLKILTAKPIIAKSEEIENNSRSRSAKFRVAQKINY